MKPAKLAAPLPVLKRGGYLIDILANYFSIVQTDKNDHIYMYSVGFQGEGTERPAAGRMSRRAVYCMIEQNYNELRTGINIATDFSQWVITRHQLPHREMPLRVDYWDEDSTPGRSRHTYYTEVSHQQTLSFGDFVRACQGTVNLHETTINHTTMALNLIFSRRPAKYSIRNSNENPTIACLGARKSFDLANQALLSGGLVAHNGLKRSVVASRQPTLNINTTAGVFFPEA